MGHTKYSVENSTHGLNEWIYYFFELIKRFTKQTKVRLH